ncbi:MAG: hypothetical protein ACI8QD_000903 [Cyclobacteriaceae bacterium]|jgi:hypothetical protein
MRVLITTSLCILFSQLICQTGTDAFSKYWYAGEAEITSYELQQARYGELRKGHCVMVFVTEPFSRAKQVKLDRASQSSENVTVMKLNFIKKFNTGIYPYSMMTSSFVPVSFDKYPDAMKVTTSSQEWCGHTFTQLNLDDDAYRFREFSYFESEGDREVELEVDWLEDELWQRIRLDPSGLPLGQISILPSTMYARLGHKSPVALSAMATLSVKQSIADDAKEIYEYKLNYPDRTLAIRFEKDFPYAIVGWEETYQGLTTTASIIRRIKSPYWQKNANKDEYLRTELGIE